MNERNDDSSNALPPLAAPLPAVSIDDFAAGLRSGQFTAEATTRVLLDRIAATNRQLDAFTFVDEDGALAAARAIDLLVKARTDFGPLMGVPIALKDLYAADGLPLRAGTRVD